MDRKIIAAGAFFGLMAVALGAFGAHGLKNYLDASQLLTFETGVRYQFYHAFLLLAIGMIGGIAEGKKKLTSVLCVVGIILFSGSIYLLATDSMNDFNFKVIGFVTPIGGLLLMVAWLLLFIEFLRKKS